MAQEDDPTRVGEAYEKWFVAKVEEALADPRPGLTVEEMNRLIAARIASLLKGSPPG